MKWIFQASRSHQIIVMVVLSSAVLLPSCGKSDSGAAPDQSPTFHAIAIVGSPLPTNPIAAAILLTSGIDCYPGATVRLYGIDTIFAKGSDIPSATDATSKMQWSSSAPSVASVSAGTVTCISQGTTQISGSIPGTACDGAGTPCLPTQITATVGSEKHTLTLSPNSITLNAGQSQQLSVSLTTETAPGVSTTEDVSAAVFSAGTPEFIPVGGANAPPIDQTNTHNGYIVAQGSGSTILVVGYENYTSNMVLFTSK